MNFQKMLEFRNANNPAVTRLGIFVRELSPGYARVTKTVEAEDMNPLGVPHGGIYFSMADTACGSAVAATYGRMAVTMSANYNFFRSGALGDTLTAEAREVKAGKTICVYEARITDQDGALLGSGTFTFYLLEKEIVL